MLPGTEYLLSAYEVRGKVMFVCQSTEERGKPIASGPRPLPWFLVPGSFCGKGTSGPLSQVFYFSFILLLVMAREGSTPVQDRIG